MGGKLATSLLNSFCSNVAKRVARSCTFNRSLRLSRSRNVATMVTCDVTLLFPFKPCEQALFWGGGGWGGGGGGGGGGEAGRAASM